MNVFKQNPIVLNYILFIAHKILFQNTKFKSNDVSDILILYALDPLGDQSKILTQDGKFKIIYYL